MTEITSRLSTTFPVLLVVLFACGPKPDDSVSFDMVAVLNVGLNPHQIAFSKATMSNETESSGFGPHELS